MVGQRRVRCVGFRPALCTRDKIATEKWASGMCPRLSCRRASRGCAVLCRTKRRMRLRTRQRAKLRTKRRAKGFEMANEQVGGQMNDRANGRPSDLASDQVGNSATSQANDQVVEQQSLLSGEALAEATGRSGGAHRGAAPRDRAQQLSVLRQGRARHQRRRVRLADARAARA